MKHVNPEVIYRRLWESRILVATETESRRDKAKLKVRTPVFWITGNYFGLGTGAHNESSRRLQRALRISKSHAER
jgi:hypothetical protein